MLTLDAVLRCGKEWNFKIAFPGPFLTSMLSLYVLYYSCRTCSSLRGIAVCLVVLQSEVPESKTEWEFSFPV